MRFALGRTPSDRDRERYLNRQPTADRSGPHGAFSQSYRRSVRTALGESAITAFERVRRRIFDYDIFPATLVGRLVTPSGPIVRGSTIVQRLGLGMIFVEGATRVVDVWDTVEPDGSRRAGFAYVTLQGHPERGVATFEVRLERDAVFVVLTSRSVPGTLITGLVSPLMRLVQRGITRRALRLLSEPLTSTSR
jgi:uncharacterized protein (UPF0548 family)